MFEDVMKKFIHFICNYSSLSLLEFLEFTNLYDGYI